MASRKKPPRNKPAPKRGWERRWHHSVFVVNREGKIVQDWPHLEKMFDYARRTADFYGFDTHPYDALLFDYEPGLSAASGTTASAVTAMTMRPPIRPPASPFDRKRRHEAV